MECPSRRAASRPLLRDARAPRSRLAEAAAFPQPQCSLAPEAWLPIHAEPVSVEVGEDSPSLTLVWTSAGSTIPPAALIAVMVASRSSIMMCTSMCYSLAGDRSVTQVPDTWPVESSNDSPPSPLVRRLQPKRSR